jgi:hypothetical protein
VSGAASSLIAHGPMLETPGDERRLCNGRDDTHGPTAAARTASQIDREHPAQALHPAHRGAELDLKSVVSALGRGRRSGDDVVAMFGIRGEQTVIAQQMRARHQRGEKVSPGSMKTTFSCERVSP